MPVGEQLYGAETTGRIWRLDPGGIWVELGHVEARDLAVDPTDPNLQLAPDYDTNLWISTDGATTWTPLADAPSMVEVEWVAGDRIVGASEDGTIWTTTSPRSEWIKLASGPAEVETFHIDSNGRWWVTVHGGAIARSDDGRTWTDVYVPPTRS